MIVSRQERLRFCLEFVEAARCGPIGVGMDLRVQKTYKALKDSFTELLGEMPYEDITIGMLCDRAMIRRTTFYKHFSDKNDFFHFYMEQIQSDFINGFQSDADPSDLYGFEIDVLDYMTSYLIDHEALIDRILEGSALDNLIWKLTDFMADEIERTIGMNEELSKVIGTSAHSISLFVAGGISKLVVDWWMNGHTEEGRVQIADMIELIDSRIESLF